MSSSKFPRRLLSIFQFSLYLVLVAFLASCGAEAKEKELPPPVVSQGTPADGVVVKLSSLTEQVSVTGSLVANQQVDLVSELTRRVVKVNVKEGSLVKQGDLLFELDNEDLNAQLEKLRQQEKLALLNEERLRDLIAHEAVVQQDYDESFTNLKVLQAQVLELQVAIRKTRIRAPFSGQIGIIHVYPGALVSTNTVLTTIVDNSLVKVEFSVPEKYVNVIAPGSTHSFTVVSDSKQYATRIIAREAEINPGTRTLLVRAVTQNPGGVLIPGQSVRLNLSLHAAEQALMVASHALIPSSLGYSVFVSRNGEALMVPVEIGQRNTDAVEITKGLHDGDTVVTSNMLRLRNGSSIQFVTLK